MLSLETGQIRFGFSLGGSRVQKTEEKFLQKPLGSISERCLGRHWTITVTVHDPAASPLPDDLSDRDFGWWKKSRRSG